MEIAIPYIISECKGKDFQRYLKNITNFVTCSHSFQLTLLKGGIYD